MYVVVTHAVMVVWYPSLSQPKKKNYWSFSYWYFAFRKKKKKKKENVMTFYDMVRGRESLLVQMLQTWCHKICFNICNDKCNWRLRRDFPAQVRRFMRTKDRCFKHQPFHYLSLSKRVISVTWVHLQETFMHMAEFVQCWSLKYRPFELLQLTVGKGFQKMTMHVHLVKQLPTLLSQPYFNTCKKKPAATTERYV